MSKQAMLTGIFFAVSVVLGSVAHAGETSTADGVAQNYRHQMLTGDFTCDDVVDRIAGWVDLDSPDGPRFAMLFVTNHGGEDQSEVRYLPFESAEQIALCVYDETAPPLMSWQENSTEFMAEVIGDDRLCNFAIRVDDFMCDAPQFFYSQEPAGNGDHWLFFRN